MSAIISDCGTFRYLLTREIDFGSYKHEDYRKLCILLFIMLNPSTADATLNDATILRCMAYARRWGFGILEVVNLFAYRATDPNALKGCNPGAVIGPMNDKHILSAANRAEQIVCAWGTNGGLYRRDREVLGMLHREGRPLHALKLTRWGHPSHPLYLRADLQPIPFG